jgi:hypothetical protein
MWFSLGIWIIPSVLKINENFLIRVLRAVIYIRLFLNIWILFSVFCLTSLIIWEIFNKG